MKNLLLQSIMHVVLFPAFPQFLIPAPLQFQKTVGDLKANKWVSWKANKWGSWRANKWGTE
jgi:hypothetical protein